MFNSFKTAILLSAFTALILIIGKVFWGQQGLIIAMSILAPIAAMLIQFAISRSREYLADETGARVSNNPLGLARALEKLTTASKRIPMDAGPATAQATSHLFIVNPFTGKSLMNLFSTHPSAEERIKRLRSMAGYRA